MRDKQGRFVKGNTGGPGRPSRATEQSYLSALSAAVSVADWRAVVTRALDDAKAGDAKAREWLAKYLIGDANADAETEPMAETDNARQRLELVGKYLLPLQLADEAHPVEEHARVAASWIMTQMVEHVHRGVDKAAG